MTMKIHHLAVFVADLARAEKFYSGVLGLTIQRRWEERSIWYDLGGAAFLAVEQVADATPGPALALALTIDAGERGAWRHRLATAGVVVERESPYSLYFRDPDGNLLGVSHWPVASAAAAL
jgi:catechol 2,3-dioxygenase-like lactoylglutathione lyase family enzyme